jgi:hypothetical protein
MLQATFIPNILVIDAMLGTPKVANTKALDEPEGDFNHKKTDPNSGPSCVATKGIN